MKKGISVEYAMKFFAKQKQKARFMHKTKYGRSLDTNWGYDKKAHQEHFDRIKNTPYDPILWDK